MSASNLFVRALAAISIGLSGGLIACACRGDSDVPPTPVLEVLPDGWERVYGGQIELRLPPEPIELSRDDLLSWVDDCARAVEVFYGRLPVTPMRVELIRSDSRGIDGGNTARRAGRAWVRVYVGVRADVADLRRDWVLTHEMVHTAMADLPEAHHWLEEGIATYVEPIARARAGLESAESVWRQLVEGLPQGLPALEDRGLDTTRTWGRTYWGGALFCFLADVEIRERTLNKFGLEDALRAIAEDGMTIMTSATIQQVLARGDKAVGVPVLSEVYARHALSSEDVDLDALWKQLGISMSRRQITFDDDAPLAQIRRAITRVEE